MTDEMPKTDPVYVLRQILQIGIKGGPGFSSAKALGDKYLNDPQYNTKLERIEALIKWEERKNFTTGFVTSMGGVVTLPVAIPASLGMNWILQTRMVAAMAYIGGFDIDDPPVRMTIALCLLGKRGKEILNQNIEDLDAYIRKRGISSIPSRTLTIVNQAIASRLMKIAAARGFTRVSKAIPVVGGIVGGVIDYQSCRETAQFAKDLFQFHLGIELQDPPLFDEM